MRFHWHQLSCVKILGTVLTSKVVCMSRNRLCIGSDRDILLCKRVV